ncbi:MAG TPA: metalloregulator ArsR/SmtB family transcription factor [Longimicrobiales bacterium]
MRAHPGMPHDRIPGTALTPQLLELIAARFKALGEPARLRILHALRSGEKSVSDLMQAAQLSQANTSKHLQRLHGLGLVERRRDGLHVFYRLADGSVLYLCDLMCGRLERQLDADRELFR